MGEVAEAERGERTGCGGGGGDMKGDGLRGE